MTRYRTYQSYSPESKFNNLIGVVVIVVLVSTVFGGILKNANFSKKSSTSVPWDGNSSFAAVLSTKPVSVVIFNPYSKGYTTFFRHGGI